MTEINLKSCVNTAEAVLNVGDWIPAAAPLSGIARITLGAVETDYGFFIASLKFIASLFKGEEGRKQLEKEAKESLNYAKDGLWNIARGALVLGGALESTPGVSMACFAYDASNLLAYASTLEDTTKKV